MRRIFVAAAMLFTSLAGLSVAQDRPTDRPQGNNFRALIRAVALEEYQVMKLRQWVAARRYIGQARRDAAEAFPDAVMLSQAQRYLLDFFVAALRYQQAANQARQLGILAPRRERDQAQPAVPTPPDPPENPPNLTRNQGPSAWQLPAKLDGIASDVSQTKSTVAKIARANSIVVPE